MKIYRSIGQDCKSCKYKYDADLEEPCLSCYVNYNKEGYFPAYTKKESNSVEKKDIEISNIGFPFQHRQEDA